MTIEIPSNAKAVIVAQLDKDESESQSDYYNSKAVRTVAIGWQYTERESFPALRKAAAGFSETVDLSAKERWFIKAVYSKDCPQANVYAGQGFLFYRGVRGPFKTKEEAQVIIDAYMPYPFMQRGRKKPFGLRLEAYHKTFHRLEAYPESCEHRENYSMGGGNYLKWGSRHSNGWKVRSLNLEYYKPGGSGWPTEWSISNGEVKDRGFSVQRLREAYRSPDLSKDQWFALPKADRRKWLDGRIAAIIAYLPGWEPADGQMFDDDWACDLWSYANKSRLPNAPELSFHFSPDKMRIECSGKLPTHPGSYIDHKDLCSISFSIDRPPKALAKGIEARLLSEYLPMHRKYAESKQRALEYEASTKGVAERLAEMGGTTPYQHSPGEFSFLTKAGYVRGQVSGKTVKLTIDRLSEGLTADFIQRLLGSGGK